jgi:predicted transcriptional regulator
LDREFSGGVKRAVSVQLSAVSLVGRNAIDRSGSNHYPEGVMDVIPIRPERKAQLDDYARRHGQDVTDALDEAPAAYLEWEQADYQEAVEAIRQGYEDVKAGRTRPAAEFFAEMRRKYGIPG